MKYPKESRPFEEYIKKIKKRNDENEGVTILDHYIIRIDNIINECGGKLLDNFFDDLDEVIDKYEG